jgi:hypothetical protein
MVQVLFERGDITEEEMGTHPDQSRLLQSLGGEDAPSPRAGSAKIAAGDVLLLCSDGFWEHLKQDELEKLVSLTSAGRQAALDEAVAEAVERAGAKADNTTAMMIHFEDGGDSPTGMRWALLLLMSALAGFVVAWWLLSDGSHSLRDRLEEISSRVFSAEESRPAKESTPPMAPPRSESSSESEEP